MQRNLQILLKYQDFFDTIASSKDKSPVTTEVGIVVYPSFEAYYQEMGWNMAGWAIRRLKDEKALTQTAEGGESTSGNQYASSEETYYSVGGGTAV